MSKTKKQKPNENSQIANKDPFFGLKFIAYCRSQRPPDGVDGIITEDIDIINYAKWRVCKSRNVLFNDPVWENYTPEEILVEYFTISFDDSEEVRDMFLAQMRGVETKDYDWLEQMESKWLKEQEEKIKEDMGGVEEFEDTF